MPCRNGDSNLPQPACRSDVLPTELDPHPNNVSDDYVPSCLKPVVTALGDGSTTMVVALVVVVVVVALSSRARILGECSTIIFIPLLRLFFFF